MHEDDFILSRSRRHQKKRNTKRWLYFFSGLAVVLIGLILLIPLLLPAADEATEPDSNQSDSEEVSADDNQPIEDDETEQITEVDENHDDEMDEPDQTVNTNQEPDQFDLSFIDSEDENVISSYTSTWQPIGTVQSEPHEITWEKDSVDWDEMLASVTLATGVEKEDMQYLWVSGNGPNKAIATFTTRDSDEHFRVYIEWIESNGYQPKQVDMLFEHDQLDRFSSDLSTEETQDETPEEEE